MFDQLITAKIIEDMLFYDSGKLQLVMQKTNKKTKQEKNLLTNFIFLKIVIYVFVV